MGAKNSKGLTPLHVSCLKPNASMVSLLLLWGADTNARDRKKRTPEQIIGNSMALVGCGLLSFGVLFAVEIAAFSRPCISFERWSFPDYSTTLAPPSERDKLHVPVGHAVGEQTKFVTETRPVCIVCLSTTLGTLVRCRGRQNAQRRQVASEKTRPKKKPCAPC